MHNNKQWTKSKQLGMKPAASLAATSHGGDRADSLWLLSSTLSFYAPCSKDMEHLRMSQRVYKCLLPDVAMTWNTWKLIWSINKCLFGIKNCKEKWWKCDMVHAWTMDMCMQYIRSADNAKQMRLLRLHTCLPPWQAGCSQEERVGAFSKRLHL